jgi:hypothetical protein
MTPITYPVTNAIGAANIANIAVFAKASVTSRKTGRRVAIDMPKSPVRTRPSQITNCMGSGLSKP